jgi:hypothetical protein
VSMSRDPFAQVICRVGFGLLRPPFQSPLDCLYIVDSSQLYPSDRSISATLELVSAVARLVKSAAP